MWKGGKGCTSIYSANHFSPLRGLDFSGETKVIRLHVIPQIQQKKKALQTVKQSLNRLAHWSLFTKPVAELPFCHLTSFYKQLAAPPSQQFQLHSSNTVFIDGYMEGGQHLPCRSSFHTWCTSFSSLSLLLNTGARSRNIPETYSSPCSPPRPLTWLPSFCQKMAGGGFPVVPHWKVMLVPWVAIWSRGFVAIWGGTVRGNRTWSAIIKPCFLNALFHFLT